MDTFKSSVLTFFILMLVLPASILTFLSSNSTSVDLPLLLFICSGFLHQHSYFYLFIFSSYRSELFFHPVLLHETRATLKASLLFLVCP